MSTVPGGVKKPKNEDYTNIVEQERERIQTGEGPHPSVISKKTKMIRIIGGVILIAVWAVLLVLLFSRQRSRTARR